MVFSLIRALIKNWSAWGPINVATCPVRKERPLASIIKDSITVVFPAPLSPTRKFRQESASISAPLIFLKLLIFKELINKFCRKKTLLLRSLPHAAGVSIKARANYSFRGMTTCRLRSESGAEIRQLLFASFSSRETCSVSIAIKASSR